MAIAAIAAAGAVGGATDLPAISATLGPTAYVFAAHPATTTARLRNALLGHGVAVSAGLGCLAASGQWGARPDPLLHGPGLAQAAAAACALGATLVALELLDAHHAPAAATALLVATGVCGPMRPLGGLLVGLAAVLLVGPLLARLPWRRAAAVRRAARSGDL
ncbi:MAG TPA: HPP family protein [Acidimicrobiales bacterium]|nr:HPP family protein [Acidimicrobiales bacterium]